MMMTEQEASYWEKNSYMMKCFLCFLKNKTKLRSVGENVDS